MKGINCLFRPCAAIVARLLFIDCWVILRGELLLLLLILFKLVSSLANRLSLSTVVEGFDCCEAAENGFILTKVFEDTATC